MTVDLLDVDDFGAFQDGQVDHLVGLHEELAEVRGGDVAQAARTTQGDAVAELEQVTTEHVVTAFPLDESALLEIGEQPEGGRLRYAGEPGDLADAQGGTGMPEGVEELQRLGDRRRRLPVHCVQVLCDGNTHERPPPVGPSLHVTTVTLRSLTVTIDTGKGQTYAEILD